MSIHVIKEPAWLSSLADQRLALIEHSGVPRIAKQQGVNIIVTFLLEPEDESVAAHQFWEHSCDSCKTFPGAQYDAHVIRSARNGVPVLMTFNVCAQCKTTFE